MRAFCITVALLAAACAPPKGSVAVAPQAGSSVEDVRRAQTDAFRELAAADARFAHRAHLEPTQADLARAMQASITAEEAGALLGGAPDPFTRAPRTQALARAQQRLAALAPSDPTARAELAVLRAVVREEEARFVREAKLPEAAVRLIHSLAQLEPPRSAEERALNDAALSRRLGEIEDALESADSLDGDSIEDALDELEPQVTVVYPEATKALTSLRLAASRGLPPPKGERPLPPLARPLPADAQPRWIALRARVHEELVAWQSAADTVNAGDREQEATQLVLGRAACAASTRPAALSPPPERSFACGALVRGAEQPLLLKLVVHDLLTLGLWSLELAHDRSDYRRVLSKYAMAGRVPGDVGGKLARRVAAEPEAALRAAMVGEELAALPEGARPRWIRDYLERGAFLTSELLP